MQSEKMASQGILTAEIAYEINNPLNFINAGVLAIDTYIEDNCKDLMDKLSPIVEGIKIGVKQKYKMKIIVY